MANEGTVKAYFRGNGANVMKNIPETVSFFVIIMDVKFLQIAPLATGPSLSPK